MHSYQPHGFVRFLGRTAAFAGALILVSIAAPRASAQETLPETHSNYIHALELPSRAAWQLPEQVVAKLGLKSGDKVADLGAGSGYFTMLLAKAVGAKGKVYAVDILPEMLDYIRQRAQLDEVKNIEIVQAQSHDPKLPPASVDMIFICDTLHHISDRATYYPLLIKALRPGGRLVNIDFYKKPLPTGPPPIAKIDKPDMIEEAKAAGFHVVQDYDFLPYQYFLIFQM
jgi:ubiquinone/menaquinone biosynthesis C-methylase UbiE